MQTELSRARMSDSLDLTPPEPWIRGVANCIGHDRTRTMPVLMGMNLRIVEGYSTVSGKSGVHVADCLFSLRILFL